MDKHYHTNDIFRPVSLIRSDCSKMTLLHNINFLLIIREITQCVLYPTTDYYIKPNSGKSTITSFGWINLEKIFICYFMNQAAIYS